MENVYFGSFEKREDIEEQFEVKLPNNIEIIYASYETPSYEGYALVIYKTKDGKYFEVEGSHCSCMGLEGQWEPKEVSPSYLVSLTGKDARYFENPEHKAHFDKIILKEFETEGK